MLISQKSYESFPIMLFYWHFLIFIHTLEGRGEASALFSCFKNLSLKSYHPVLFAYQTNPPFPHLIVGHHLFPWCNIHHSSFKALLSRLTPVARSLLATVTKKKSNLASADRSPFSLPGRRSLLPRSTKWPKPFLPVAVPAPFPRRADRVLHGSGTHPTQLGSPLLLGPGLPWPPIWGQRAPV